jgi:acetylornithine deacetylase/succinyl-diaminopimelate desuccinylase-like protein
MMHKRLLLGIIFLLAGLPGALRGQSMPDFAAAKQETLERLQALIRIDTSNPPGNETNGAEFLKTVLDREGIASEIVAKEPTRGNLIARLKGNGSKRPLLLMGHMDTVGVDRAKWNVDPFAATIQDGYLYGRGAIDDKIDVAAMLQIFLMIKRAGLALDRDIIYLAAAGEEGGPPVGIDYLVEEHWPKIESEFALNEGGEIMLRDGEVRYVGVQTAEKIPRGLKLIARGSSGHGSMPRADNAIVHLAAAIAKVGTYQSPMKLNDTTRTFFERLATISPPEEAFLFRNLEDEVLGPLIEEKFRRSQAGAHIAYNSMLRNSISPNMIEGGFRVNVIPGEAEAMLDVRLLPGEDRETLMAELRRVIDDPAVEVVANDWVAFPAAPAMPLDSALFLALERAQQAVFPGKITLPTMSTGATDSAKVRAKGVLAYGVGTLRTDDDESRMHGDNERVWVEGIEPYLEFLYRAVIEVAASQ